MHGTQWAIAALFLTAGLLSAGPQDEAKRASLSDVYDRLVIALGDQNLSLEERQTAMRMLKQGDKKVIPVLIARLTDGRTFNPSVEDLSGPADGPKEKYSMTVGMACEDILYSIVRAGGKAGPVIQNWKEWWRQNESKSLPEIIREMGQRNK